jgi:hypothetical protein
VNLVVGYLLLARVGHFDPRVAEHAIPAGLGVLVMGLVAARVFGRFHGGNSPTGS